MSDAVTTNMVGVGPATPPAGSTAPIGATAAGGMSGGSAAPGGDAPVPGGTVITDDRPVLHPAIWAAVAAVLAVLLAWRGYEMGQAMKLGQSTIPIARLVPLVLGVTGFLGGAGLGLLLADIRRVTTTTVPGPNARAAAPTGVLPSVISAAKDLTPGKLLVLLAVALLSATLFAASPDGTAATDDTPNRGNNQGRGNT